ncbi:autotransporter outer membrane beta-barrel domain-containing protein [Bartonella sp. CB175]|uniref:autotransporter outer membrane beta-barrel domain-containing protein n=1 Tax=Bartonella sp. CB175 TaxID=3112256 RepID=UPI00300DCEDA
MRVFIFNEKGKKVCRKIMIKMSKNHLPLYTFTTAIFFFAHNANTNAANTNVANTNAANTNVPSSRENLFTCNDNDQFYRCKDGKSHEISHKTYKLRHDAYGAITALGKNTSINAKGITIDGANTGSNSNSEELQYGVRILEEGKVSLANSVLKDASIGVDVDYGVFDIQNGLIEATRRGVSVGGHQSLITLTNTKINMGVNAIGLFSHNNAEVQMVGGAIDFKNGVGIQTGGGGKITLNRVIITEKGNQAQGVDSGSKNAALHMLQGSGRINIQNSTVDVTNAHGLLLEGVDNRADIKDSAFIVKSGTPFYGMGFFWETVFNGKKTLEAGRGTVHLENTMFITPSSTAIYNKKFGSSIQLSKGTTVFGDLLLKVEDNSSVKIAADSSIIIGRTYVDDSSTAEIKLSNNSKWILSKPVSKELQNFLSKNLNSIDLSSVHLTDSSIHFNTIKSNMLSNYQTLRVGKGAGTVYTAQGKARLYLNTCLGKGGDLYSQKTDRLLIHGNVEGETTVYVRGVPVFLGHLGESTGKGNDKGISIIQVSGQANKDSFKLAGGYTVFVGSPYQYHLVAYGPSSNLGLANINQRLVAGQGSFWDFRLESKAVLPYVAPAIDPDEAHHTFTDDVFHSVTNINPNVTEPGVSPTSTDVERPSVIAPSFPYNPDTTISSVVPTLPDSNSISPNVSASPDTNATFVTSTVFTKPESDEFPVRPHTPTASDTDVILDRPTAPTVSDTDSTAVFMPAVPESNSPVIVPVIPTLIAALERVTSFGNNVRAVVPQVPTYLLLPNALFHSSLMDINNQRKQLETMRAVSSRLLKIDKNPTLFTHGYSGNHRYNSDLSPLEYGYGGDFDYNAIEAGISLKTIESLHYVASFGVMGGYGQLSLQPLNVEQSQKSTFDKWLATAYGSLEYDMGFYVDGLLSYGLFKGDVSTLARGKTASLKANPLSTSLTVGKAFTTGDTSIVFDPQVQFIYQQLHFKKARDVDGFDIKMGKSDQLTMRVGGRLTKTLSIAKEAHVVSFYSKLHLTHNFEKQQSVYFKDAFQLGSSGSSLEAGIGFNAQLFPKLTFYGDLSYQHKLTKAGFWGTTFSGGLSYRF